MSNPLINNPIFIQPVKNPHSIIQVIHAAFERYEHTNMPSSAMLETADSIQEDLTNQCIILGAYEQNQLVGVVKVTIHDNHLYFGRLSVLPLHQGKGIASLLIEALKDLAKQHKKPFIKCTVRKAEEANVRLYHRLGYTIEQEKETVNCNGLCMDVYIMNLII